MARRGDTAAVGRRGEEAAARFLGRQGLVVLERNLRSRLGEVDIVAREGETLVFVEVKARQEGLADPPEAAVRAPKRARLARLALAYLAARRLGERPCRFDVIAVVLGEDGALTDLRHHRGAFDVDGRTG
jgi:putative endonuclease